MKKINERILIGLAMIASFVIFAFAVSKPFAGYESEKNLINSVVELSSVTYENKLAYFVRDNGKVSIKQIDSIRKESDKEVKGMLLKLLNDK